MTDQDSILREIAESATSRRDAVRRLAGAAVTGNPDLTDPDIDTIESGREVRSLYLNDEWVEQLNVIYDDVRYEFVEENGELRLERADND